MTKLRQLATLGLAGLIISIWFGSCSSTKNVAYFKNISDSARDVKIAEAQYQDLIIQPDDILSITIVTIDPSTTTPVNQETAQPVSMSGSSSLGTTQMVPGLLVDKNGDISLPILGTIHVGGFSTFQAKAQIKKVAEKYFKEPDVQIRFVNFKVTVIGEVNRPATFTMPNEKVSVLDALGMAGDLTIYGQRENVLLIRDEDGKKNLVRMNLNDAALMSSPYFYLKQNDVIYVQPNKSKAIQADAAQTRIVTIAASIIAGVILIFRFK